MENSPQKGIIMNNKDVIILLKIKTLLNQLRYVIKNKDLKILDDYNELCRKHCTITKEE